ncbi:MAG: DUF4097 family beta strand repeat protein [Oscillospiraceae bacterium]|nr:DUF4097 family beta strand repeat protein [Oscillospiraceae bacterium]
MKKRAIIIAVILVLVGIAVFAAAFVVSGFDFSKFAIDEYETNTYEVSENFDKIEINTKESNITFKPSEDGVCRLVCTEKNVKHSVNVENGTLKIVSEDKREWYDYITFFSKSLSMTVYLPANFYEEFNINGSTGDVQIPESFSAGSIDIKVSTGDIVCKASVSGSILLKTGTGDIDIKEMAAGSVAISVSTGRVDVEKVSCEEDFSVKVGTGKAKLTDLTCKNFDSTGGTGNISLKNVVAADNFKIERSTGDVNFENCDADQIDIKTSTGDITGTIKTAKIFTAKTSSGSVRVPESESGGKCKLTTSSGDISVDIIG